MTRRIKKTVYSFAESDYSRHRYKPEHRYNPESEEQESKERKRKGGLIKKIAIGAGGLAALGATGVAGHAVYKNNKSVRRVADGVGKTIKEPVKKAFGVGEKSLKEKAEEQENNSNEKNKTGFLSRVKKFINRDKNV